MKTVYRADNKIESLRELLPWYITDSLSEDEKKELEAALKKHDFLREELEQEKELAKLLSAETDDKNLVQTAQAQQQKRLDNLLERIDFAESALLQDSDTSTHPTQLVEKQSKQQAEPQKQVTTAITPKKAKKSYITIQKTYLAYAASFAFLMGSAFIIYHYFNPSQTISSGTKAVTYEVSSADTRKSEPQGEGEAEASATQTEKQKTNAENQNILLVSFSQFARQHDISQLLFKINARIIDGPDHSMTYRIEIKGEPTEEQLEASMDILNKNNSLITFVGRAC